MVRTVLCREVEHLLRGRHWGASSVGGVLVVDMFAGKEGNSLFKESKSRTREGEGRLVDQAKKRREGPALERAGGDEPQRGGGREKTTRARMFPRK